MCGLPNITSYIVEFKGFDVAPFYEHFKGPHSHRSVNNDSGAASFELESSCLLDPTTPNTNLWLVKKKPTWERVAGLPRAERLRRRDIVALVVLEALTSQSWTMRLNGWLTLHLARLTCLSLQGGQNL